MNIRVGSSSDAEAVAGLIAYFQSELTDDPSGAGAERFLASVSVQAERDYLASARYRYLLAFSGSELAGFIAIRDGSHLFHLFVGQAHQRQGLGRLLWQRALRELWTRTAKEFSRSTQACRQSRSIAALALLQRVQHRASMAFRFFPCSARPR